MVSVIKGRDLLVKSVRFNVGGGEDINIWEDPWLPRLSNFKVSSPRPANTILIKASNLIVSSTRQWNSDLVHANFSNAEAAIILSIPISIGKTRDKWIWHPSLLVGYFFG